MKKISAFLVALFVSVAMFTASPVQANHSWGNYHWQRSSNPFALQVGDNLTPEWDPFLATTIYDWSLSSVLDLVSVPGNTLPKQCKPSLGRVEVCNSKYGRNGWLGIAQIWTSGGHIVQGVTKLNDTYFIMAKYNTPAWKNLVTCQEVGHTLGLDHQDETFDNVPLGTCMDYSNNPVPNQHPNDHDYEELLAIYQHLDTVSGASVTGQNPAGFNQGSFENAKDWGRELKNNGYTARYEKDLGFGRKVHTFVIWSHE